MLRKDVLGGGTEVIGMSLTKITDWLQSIKRKLNKKILDIGNWIYQQTHNKHVSHIVCHWLRNSFDLIDTHLIYRWRFLKFGGGKIISIIWFKKVGNLGKPMHVGKHVH